MADSNRDSRFGRCGISVGGDINHSHVIIANGPVNIRSEILANNAEVSKALVLKNLMTAKDWVSVLDFMERTFCTRILKELRASELGRVKAYAKKIINNQNEI